MQTNRSSPSGSGTASPASRQQRRGKAGTNSILRNYYGLQSDEAGGQARATSTPAERRSSDPTDADGTSFDADLAFDKLLKTQSLSRLLKEESDLLTTIRELDGERQSLVYNHHHELVSASETMRKMKERADTLLPSLNSLQTSLQSITTTTDVLDTSQKHIGPLTGPEAQLAASVKSIVELPRRLRDMVVLGDGDMSGSGEEGLRKAQGLWGSMESVLAAWDEAGVSGAKEIMHECRLVLREAAQNKAAVTV